MAVTRYWLYECDLEGCEEEEYSEGPRTSWDVNKNGYTLCQTHRVYPLCLGCDRKLRPFQSRAEDHPGTFSQQSAGRCHSCSQDNAGGVVYNTQLNQAVRAYLTIRTTPFRDLWDTEGLEEDARKIAPEDVWEALGI